MSSRKAHEGEEWVNDGVGDFEFEIISRFVGKSMGRSGPCEDDELTTVMANVFAILNVCLTGGKVKLNDYAADKDVLQAFLEKVCQINVKNHVSSRPAGAQSILDNWPPKARLATLNMKNALGVRQDTGPEHDDTSVARPNGQQNSQHGDDIAMWDAIDAEVDTTEHDQGSSNETGPTSVRSLQQLLNDDFFTDVEKARIKKCITKTDRHVREGLRVIVVQHFNPCFEKEHTKGLLYELLGAATLLRRGGSAVSIRERYWKPEKPETEGVFNWLFQLEGDDEDLNLNENQREGAAALSEWPKDLQQMTWRQQSKEIRRDEKGQPLPVPSLQEMDTDATTVVTHHHRAMIMNLFNTSPNLDSLESSEIDGLIQRLYACLRRLAGGESLEQIGSDEYVHALLSGPCGIPLEDVERLRYWAAEVLNAWPKCFPFWDNQIGPKARRKYPPRYHPVWGTGRLMHGCALEENAKGNWVVCLDDRPVKDVSALRHGHNGFKPGQWFPFQMCATGQGAVADVQNGVTYELQQATTITPKIDLYAVVMKGKGPKKMNIDNDSTISYAREPGKDKGNAQILRTLALYQAASSEVKKPVRVIRALRHPIESYRYDGLYYVTGYKDVAETDTIAAHTVFTLARFEQNGATKNGEPNDEYSQISLEDCMTSEHDEQRKQDVTNLRLMKKQKRLPWEEAESEDEDEPAEEDDEAAEEDVEEEEDEEEEDDGEEGETEGEEDEEKTTVAEQEKAGEAMEVS